MSKSKPIGVRLKPQERKRLEEAAHGAYIPVTTLANAILLAWLDGKHYQAPEHLHSMLMRDPAMTYNAKAASTAGKGTK